MSVLLKNLRFLLPDCVSWQEGSIRIEGDRIAALGSLDEEPTDEVVDCRGKIAIPGLINAHAHSYTGYLKGSIDNVPLDIYMLHAIAGGSCRSEREIYISTALEAMAMLKLGTTAVVDHFSERPRLSPEGIAADAAALRDVGLRARVATMFADKGFFETLPLRPGELPQELLPKSGGKPQSVREYLEVVEESYLRFRDDPLLDVMLGTDGPQRCSDELLLGTGALEEKYHMGWETHILEAKTQAIISRSLYGKDLLEHMEELGILNERTALVHHVWVSEKEQELVARAGATVVHCPSSNLHLGSGIAPVREYIARGIPVALGSDGGNCGGVGMLDQIKLTALLHNVSETDYEKWFSAEQALKMDYEGGARIFRENIGVLAPGAQADITLIDTENVFWQPINHLTRQLVYYENGSHVDTVYVRGVKVLENGRCLGVCEEDILAEAVEICEKLRRDCAEAFALVEKQTPYLRTMYLREIQKDIGFNRFSR